MAKKAEPKPEFQFELDGQVIEMNSGDLTFGEVEFIETYFGLPLGECPLESARGAMVLTAIAKQRKAPTTSYVEQLAALRDVKVNAFSTEVARGKRPTKAAEPETSGSPS